ncbi:hypothetical protein TBLA_0C06450 [Henningerozyma blattae CBS 6284]|uniref:Pseudouridine synthase RsuA/RluA-like domain-containing protein n=1 Tax=Henningerozyma blattae (strain ATCC 34711 / CBS 6284 / DSM 70876 / NBRC 10599 / NRRL Y-10934 / UCD 77-7) TaxID=1071380 RepID=I2H236_HENB6|nr:hypothetical protein TBLA_0C06450 [Tetrapisispora blattae CBS 6284]CCH60438.1 hypothetical protein TBLA_0C06450 [Tetrapisispora blattae CBS 6284]
MDPEIYVRNGLRFVKPYYSTRQSHVKGRWLGRALPTVLENEFKMSFKKGVKQITCGDIKLMRSPPGSSSRVLSVEETLNEKITPADILISRSHKHEPPVPQWPSCGDLVENILGVPIVFKSSNLLVIDKPSGLPVHPTGQYFYNTLTKVLELGDFPSLRPAFRLDKPTSGLLVLARDTETAGTIQKKIKEHSVTKLYFARVKGKFQDIPLSHSSSIFTIELKRTFDGAFSIPRDATTEFSLWKYSPKLDESIILCKPITGRTHQIRIHLARLGFPIINDPFFNINCTRFPKRTQFIIDNEDWRLNENLKLNFNEFMIEQDSQLDMRLNSKKCPECDAELWHDPDMKEMKLYLHAWKYEGLTDFPIETKLPSWVEELAI